MCLAKVGRKQIQTKEKPEARDGNKGHSHSSDHDVVLKHSVIIGD